jgi:hypothetical protein
VRCFAARKVQDYWGNLQEYSGAVLQRENSRTDGAPKQ